MSAVPHRVVAQLILVVLAQPQAARRPGRGSVYHAIRRSRQYSYHFRDVVRMAEELDLHLLELARAEREIPRRDFVAKALADLRDAERNPHARAVEHVLEVDEDALGRFRPQEGRVLFAAHRADDRLEHQVELARLGERARAPWRPGASTCARSSTLASDIDVAFPRDLVRVLGPQLEELQRPLLDVFGLVLACDRR